MNSSITTRPRAGRTATFVAGLLAAGLVVSGCGGGGDDAKPSSASSTTSSSAAARTTGPANPSASATSTDGTKAAAAGSWGKYVGSGKVKVGDTSLIAQATASSVKVYAKKNGSASNSLASPLPSGATLTFLVLERDGDWLRVLLPVRPNGAQGWIKKSQVKILQTDYRLTVSTGSHQLKVFRSGSQVMSVKIGLGSQTTPTPGGVFYVKELLKPPNPSGSYGPYAYGLSGYSDVLNEFLGGNGEIGIHGTDDPSSVGKNVSHGCIRLKNSDITKLAQMLPLGTPVQIIA